MLCLVDPMDLLKCRVLPTFHITPDRFSGIPERTSPNQLLPLTSLSLFPVSSLARMKPPMGLLEVSPIEVGIDLRRRDIRMSQHGLN